MLWSDFLRFVFPIFSPVIYVSLEVFLPYVMTNCFICYISNPCIFYSSIKRCFGRFLCEGVPPYLRPEVRSSFLWISPVTPSSIYGTTILGDQMNIFTVIRITLENGYSNSDMDEWESLFSTSPDLSYSNQ